MTTELRRRVSATRVRTAGVVGAWMSGALMGAADLVPGVSGGTVALALGVYQRLVTNLGAGAEVAARLLRLDPAAARRRLEDIEWWFLVPLLVGVLTAVAALAGVLRHLLETEPVAMSALFLGLVVGSIVVALEEVDRADPPVVSLGLGVAVVTFLALGLRAGRMTDPSLAVLFAGGAVAVCAMILPGISGSFILLLGGLYQPVITAVDERQIVAVAAVGAGAVVGLGVFARLLDRLLRRHHAPVLAALIGLMAGSLRVLWPWPAGADGVGDTGLAPPVAGETLSALGLALGGVVGVIVVARLARVLNRP